MAISAGVTIACSDGMIKVSQASPSTPKTPTHQSSKSKSTVHNSSNIRSQNSKPLTLQKSKQKLQRANLISETLSQSPEKTPSKPATSKPNALEPNANPLLFPTSPGEVKVENEQAITLEQAVQLALRNNKQLQQARLTLEASRKALKGETAGQYPALTLQGSVQNSDSASGASSVQIGNQQRQQAREQIREQVRQENPTLTEQQADEIARQQVGSSSQDSSQTTFNGGLQLSYDLYSGGQTSARIRRAERTAKRDELELERIAEDTRSQATQRYYELQNADSQVEIEQGAVRDAQQTLRDAQLLEQAGLGTRFDVLRAEVELARAQQRLSTAKAGQSNARRQLVNTLSLAENVNLVTADEVKEAGAWKLALEDSIVLAYKNRAELERFLVEREISDQDREIALSQTRPQVNLAASYDLFDQLDESEADLTDGYTLQAQMQWRFFDWGSSRAFGEQAEAQKQAAEAQFAGQRNTVRFEVEQAFNNQIANKENIATSKKGLDLAEESLRLARLRFQAGVGTQTDVIDAQRQLTDARGDFTRAIIEYNQSLNQLQRAVSNFPEDKLFDIVP
jgi:outer membrane protein TolC